MKVRIESSTTIVRRARKEPEPVWEEEEEEDDDDDSRDDSTLSRDLEGRFRQKESFDDDETWDEEGEFRSCATPCERQALSHVEEEEEAFENENKFVVMADSRTYHTNTASKLQEGSKWWPSLKQQTKTAPPASILTPRPLALSASLSGLESMAEANAVPLDDAKEDQSLKEDTSAVPPTEDDSPMSDNTSILNEENSLPKEDASMENDDTSALKEVASDQPDVMSDDASSDIEYVEAIECQPVARKKWDLSKPKVIVQATTNTIDEKPDETEVSHLSFFRKLSLRPWHKKKTMPRKIKAISKNGSSLEKEPNSPAQKHDDASSTAPEKAASPKESSSPPQKHDDANSTAPEKAASLKESSSLAQKEDNANITAPEKDFSLKESNSSVQKHDDANRTTAKSTAAVPESNDCLVDSCWKRLQAPSTDAEIEMVYSAVPKDTPEETPCTAEKESITSNPSAKEETTETPVEMTGPSGPEETTELPKQVGKSFSEQNEEPSVKLEGNDSQVEMVYSKSIELLGTVAVVQSKTGDQVTLEEDETQVETVYSSQESSSLTVNDNVSLDCKPTIGEVEEVNESPVMSSQNEETEPLSATTVGIRTENTVQMVALVDHSGEYVPIPKSKADQTLPMNTNIQEDEDGFTVSLSLADSTHAGDTEMCDNHGPPEMERSETGSKAKERKVEKFNEPMKEQATVNMSIVGIKQGVADGDDKSENEPSTKPESARRKWFKQPRATLMETTSKTTNVSDKPSTPSPAIDDILVEFGDENLPARGPTTFATDAGKPPSARRSRLTTSLSWMKRAKTNELLQSPSVFTGLTFSPQYVNHRTSGTTENDQFTWDQVMDASLMVNKVMDNAATNVQVDNRPVSTGVGTFSTWNDDDDALTERGLETALTNMSDGARDELRDALELVKYHANKLGVREHDLLWAIKNEYSLAAETPRKERVKPEPPSMFGNLWDKLTQAFV